MIRNWQTSNPTGYLLMLWCTCPMNETLVHHQASHQLHHPHPSQWHWRGFTCLCDITCLYIKLMLHVVSALWSFRLMSVNVKQINAWLCISCMAASVMWWEQPYHNYFVGWQAISTIVTVTASCLSCFFCCMLWLQISFEQLEDDGSV